VFDVVVVENDLVDYQECGFYRINGLI
jgi:hypothetical protein